MPKRKSENSYDHIKRKIKKLEKELRRRSRSRSRSRRKRRHHRRHQSYSTESDVSSSSRSRDSRRTPSMDQQDDIVGYVDMDENGDMLEDRPSPGLEREQQPSDSRASPVFVPSVVVVPTKDIHLKPPAASEPLTNMTDTSAPPASAAPAGSAPADSAPTGSAPACSAPSAAQPEIEELPLDTELLNILGSDPTNDKDLSVRFQHWTTTGLSKEMRKELKENYLTPDNCRLIDPPELNAEIKAAVSDIVAKRDKAIEGKQKQLTAAITCLGEAITRVLSSKEKDTELLKRLMDAARLTCDCQHADTVTRRNFLLNTVKKEMREQLQNTKIDKLLFGENLAETLKSAKAINKSGTELKSVTSKIQNKKQTVPSTSNSAKNLNWRNPGQARRQTGPPRMKEPAMTSTRSRQPASSKLSQHPQRTSQRRH